MPPPDPNAPLRTTAEWERSRTLSLVGPAEGPEGLLARLLVAVATALGPVRLLDLMKELEAQGVKLRPRLKVLADGPAFRAYKKRLDEIGGILGKLEQAMPLLKARAQNDLKGSRNGLLSGDLAALAKLTYAVIAAAEIVSKPSPAGVGRALSYFEGAPTLGFVETWFFRLLKNAATDQVGFVFDGNLQRVVVIDRTGKTVYDAFPAPEI